MLIYIFLCLYFMRFTTACTCEESTLHQQVCESEFIIKGTVEAEVRGSNINSDSYYNVTVLEVLKKTSFTLPVNKTVRFWTPGNDGICRLPLRNQTPYYLGGSLHKQSGRIRIMLCDFWRKSNEMKDCERNMIINNMFDCNCKRITCFQSC